MKTIVMYTRKDCHLCDEAYLLLAKNGMVPELIDIDERVEFQSAFTDCVPVIEIDGKIRFRGRINEVLLRRLLA